MTRITTPDGIGLHVTDWGAGPPVVLIHGWPLNADAWEAQAMPLAEAGFRVIGYDRRGFGRSDKPWGGYDYDTLAGDLGAVIDGLSLDDVALVGFSMGGGEVARYVGSRGGKGVRKAVFVGSVAPGLLKSDANPDGATRDVFEGMIEGIRKDRPQFMRDFFPSFYGQKTRGGGVSQGVLDWSFNMAMQASLPATIDCVRAFGMTDFTADMAALAGIDTLAIHGTKDVTVPIAATAHRIAKLVPGAALIEYDGAPHGLPATHPERLAQDLLMFLR